MTSTFDTVAAERRVDAPTVVMPDVDAPAPAERGLGIRRKPVTRSVRGRRTVVVPAERFTPAELASRVPFVVVLLFIIGAGVGGTLMLSAQTTQDTYNLKNARDANVELVERMESLQASNERARSAEVLAQRAEKLGMVGVASAPILTRGSDGVLEIVGEPEAKLGAPIKPLQPAPVASDPSKSPNRGGFDAPPAQAPQDRAPRGVAPVPYPPAPPALMAAPAPAPAPPVEPEPQAPAATVEPAPASPAPAPAPTAPGGDVATLAPMPGQPY